MTNRLTEMYSFETNLSTLFFNIISASQEGAGDLVLGPHEFEAHSRQEINQEFLVKYYQFLTSPRSQNNLENLAFIFDD
jgi:hypothetical protein